MRPLAEKQARARELRGSGASLNEIAAALGVSKSSVSVWVRGIPLSESHRQVLLERQASSWARRAAAIRARRERKEAELAEASRAQIGELSARDLFLVGVALYWAEGSKSKPWNVSQSVTLINSDASVICVFMRWLKLLGIGLDELTFRVAIHENADALAATEYWAGLVGVDSAQFRRPTLKRHKPGTRRRNTGEEYRGCLVVKVRCSTDLNRRIAGWWRGISEAPPTMVQAVRDGVVGARDTLDVQA